MSNNEIRTYRAWDRTTRLFHWINFICVLSLMCFGLILMNDDALGLNSKSKILIKSIHVYIGYVFVINLLWRLLWGFIGGRHARWRAILPFGKGYGQAVKQYLDGFKKKDAPMYVGHNPLGKLMVAFLLILLMSQAVTGLVVGGTDLYMPPFGGYFKQWVAGKNATPEKINAIKPGSKDNVDPAARAEMRKFRKPFIEIHELGFYLLLIAAFLHILAVVITDIREKTGLVSAMIHGEKVSRKTPVDE